MARKANLLSSIFFLKERTYLTPNYIRITLENELIPNYRNTTIGVNNKIFIAPEGCSKVHLPEFDLDTQNWKEQDPSIKPYVRTYTHRGINLDKNEIYIDFVAHGAEGPASNWAINAPIGAELGVVMGTENSELYPEAETYFLIGDATAIPVLSAILESLPKGVTANVLLEVVSEEDKQVWGSKADVTIRWIVNPTPGINSELASVAKTLLKKHHGNSKFAYVAAEFSSVKELRTFIRKDLHWKQDELHAYSYWKYGKAENMSEKDRREERSRNIE